MKVPMQWIQRYAPVACDAQTLADKMIMIGNGVESVEDLGAEVEGVVVGKVLTCEAHPDSDHLHVCTVDVGGEAPLQIVCGAPNVAAGQLVPVALVGAKLPGGVKIKKGKLRGVESSGMICSSEELGVPVELYPSVGAEGILVFREDHPLGADVRPILGIDDSVLDFEVLANRPDCLSVWGLAREAAVACGVPFTQPEISVKECGGDIHDYVQVEVADPDLCPRYIARVIKNVRVGESPMWLRKYLHGAGMRSINNVVDITNFIMLETGHPMHAFDLDMVAGRHIIVRRAAEGEHITTLDGKPHPLTPGQLVICDAEKPACVAGIMGGEESEITEKTHTMMFECAVFDRAATRITSRALGIRTESSGRFEKGVSAKTAMEAMERACQMIGELDAGDVVSGVIDLYPEPEGKQVVTGSCRKIARRTGVDIPPEEIVRILRELRFQVERDGDLLTVTVPDDRMDVEGEADLSEEALRVWGYDKIPGTLLRGETTPGGRNAHQRLKDEISSVLTGEGYCEIMNYSFVSPRTLDTIRLAADDPRRQVLPIRNPLGEDTSVMRSTLVPDMLRTLALNMNHGNERAALYEASAVFDPVHRTPENLPTEEQQLALGVYGKTVDFYTLRATVERLLRKLGVEVTSIVKAEEPYLHPGRSAVLLSGETPVCTLGEVHPAVAETCEMPGRAYIAELSLEVLQALRRPMGPVKPMPRYPAVTRDLSLVMPERTQVGPLLAAMRRAAGSILEDARMFDVYRSPLLGPDRKSIAFSFVFRGADRTLTDAEITKAMGKLLQAADAHGAVLRG